MSAAVQLFGHWVLDAVGVLVADWHPLMGEDGQVYLYEGPARRERVATLELAPQGAVVMVRCRRPGQRPVEVRVTTGSPGADLDGLRHWVRQLAGEPAADEVLAAVVAP